MDQKRRRVVKRRFLNNKADDNSRITVPAALQKIKLIYYSEGYRDRTVDDYEMYWTEFFSIIDKPFIDDVTSDDVRNYISYLKREKHLSHVTINIRLTAMKAMFNRLFLEGVIKGENPVLYIKRLKTDEKVIMGLKDNQIRRLFGAINKESFSGRRDYIAMLLMLKCGLRVNEIDSLEVEDIDFESEVIRLPGIKNKNRKTRIVPLSMKVLSELKMLTEKNRQDFGDDCKYVFVTNIGNPLLPDYLRKNMYKYASKAGLVGECKVSPHKLRHTFAINFLKNGGDIRALQLIMGHADLSTTQVYLKYDEEEIKERFNQVEENDDLDV
ncbi:DNA integration/recombination/inversion protein [Bacillus sp. LL01]|uniref:tyrosine-type recombinase/integrase n=1 Tax=Bacillus sp. LL01 TaxID=1665556 RepID=UPI00064CF606|nr:tyrosine-type recombinase/integrase [Bacillus sp. LL01]KMJ59377.1 DNA integration/recombination/inversion protein [Bacillus sp. LL01]